MRLSNAKRSFVFLIIAAITAVTLLSGAQPKRRPPAPARPPKPPAKVVDAGAAVPVKEGDASGAPTPAAAGGKAENVEVRTVDGGAKVMKFGELEIETRLKSPQLVYFLRRVRAEFAAGDLGHRTFMKELSDTRTSPAF
jgi:hypothetical protein